MTDGPLHELAEADQLLSEVASWSDEELQALSKFYREHARRYQELLKQGDPEQL